MTSLALVDAEPVRWRRAIARAGARMTWQVVVATSAIALAMEAWSLYDAAFGANEHLGAAAYVSSLIVNVLIAFSIMFTTFVADEFVAAGAPALPIYAIGVLVGSASGSIALWLVHEALWRTPATIPGLPREQVSSFAVFVFFEYLIWGAIGVWIYVQRRGEMRARARMNASRLQRTQTQRRSLEAQLAALQAQVEPRFLLDMMACARDRYEADAASGSAMLGALISYLRTALPRLRDTSSDLGRELELVRAYLDVMREHLGDRLTFESHVPDALRRARMPAMLMLPLIHHLVVPRRPVSRPPALIVADAHVVDDRLRVRIVHDGTTPFASALDDADLAGIGQRLQALYRGNATLAIDHGTRAVLEIPFEPADGDHR
jgi:hypothetical protein